MKKRGNSKARSNADQNHKPGVTNPPLTVEHVRTLVNNGLSLHALGYYISLLALREPGDGNFVFVAAEKDLERKCRISREERLNLEAELGRHGIAVRVEEWKVQ